MCTSPVANLNNTLEMSKLNNGPRTAIQSANLNEPNPREMHQEQFQQSYPLWGAPYKSYSPSL